MEGVKILKKMKELNPDGTLLFMHEGGPLTTDSFNRRLKKYCREAGVPYYSSHKIRFYNASTAYDGKNLQQSATLWDIVRWKPQSIT